MQASFFSRGKLLTDALKDILGSRPFFGFADLEDLAFAAGLALSFAPGICANSAGTVLFAPNNRR